MIAANPGDPSEAPTLEVKVYRDSNLIHTELCNTAGEAAALVAWWEETPGIECTIEDLSASAQNESSLEAGGPELDSAYPNIVDTR